MKFEDIANEIINNPSYLKLKNEEHHGLNRYDHSVRVAKMTYKMCINMNLDYVSATRAALLHDYFFDGELKVGNCFSRYRVHPMYAVNNARGTFNINGHEEDMIKTHMYPLTLKIPQSKEALALVLADKASSIYEYGKFKFSMQMGILFLFLINIIFMSNN